MLNSAVILGYGVNVRKALNIEAQKIIKLTQKGRVRDETQKIFMRRPYGRLVRNNTLQQEQIWETGAIPAKSIFLTGMVREIQVCAIPFLPMRRM